MVVEVEHPVIGRMKMLGLPVKSTGELTAIRQPAPWLGQHSAETARSLGMNDKDIEALFAAGVIYDRLRGKKPASAPSSEERSQAV
jgi:crotonobetainyl-CoA:carnitine CoA-transferase CaiB-like acyl-CoA transferase